MLLTGTYPRSLDDKMRVAIPKQIRDALADSKLYVTPGTDNALVIYTGEVLEQIGALLGSQSQAAKETRAFSRLFFAQAQPVELDKQGRMRIPVELANLAKFSNEVVVVGVRDRLEIWDAGSWTNFIEATQPSYDELAEKVFENANQNNSEKNSGT